MPSPTPQGGRRAESGCLGSTRNYASAFAEPSIALPPSRPGGRRGRVNHASIMAKLACGEFCPLSDDFSVLFYCTCSVLRLYNITRTY